MEREALKLAAQAVLDRWNSPAWKWHKLGPTADLMAGLRDALAQPAPLSAREPGNGMPEQPMPKWLSYDKASHVLTIYGKRYAAEMFGEAGFGAMAGTTLRIEAGPADVVTATRVDGVNAELLAALKLALSAHGKLLMSDPPQDPWKVYQVEAKARAAIAKAEAAMQPAIQRLPADDTEGGAV